MTFRRLLYCARRPRRCQSRVAVGSAGAEGYEQYQKQPLFRPHDASPFLGRQANLSVAVYIRPSTTPNPFSIESLETVKVKKRRLRGCRRCAIFSGIEKVGHAVKETRGEVYFEIGGQRLGYEVSERYRQVQIHLSDAEASLGPRGSSFAVDLMWRRLRWRTRMRECCGAAQQTSEL